MRAAQAIALVLVALSLTLKWANAEAQNQRDYGRRQVSSGELEGDEQMNGSEDLTQMADSRLSFSIATAGAATSANSPAGLASFQCERIEFAFCASMPYNYTRMANFFGDTNQIEAADRTKHYEHLVATRCSRHLLAYLCELLAPMCLDGDAMKKFEIFPCRSFCRQVSRECDQQIAALFHLQYTNTNSQQLPAAFQCDKLPYESNGGNGSGDRGPCHEMPEVAPGMQAPLPPPVHAVAPPGKRPSSQYWPYQNNEMNEPPFVDNSLIDTRLIRPTPPQIQGQAATPARSHEQPAVWTAQLQQLGQQLAAALLKHSNVLTLVALVCLVLVLNAKRLQRLKVCLSGPGHFRSNNSSASSRKSSSSNSSGGSQRKLTGSAAAGAANVHRKLTQLSPSASSRSLVLVTSGDRGGGHSSSCLEPSQKLLLNQANQRTLINVNGTLERQQHQDARYHLMQSMGAQQSAILTTTTKHHYDYIQVPVGVGGGRQSSSKSSGRGSTSCAQLVEQQHQQQQQVYDNILLSSPSHQILLFGDQQPARARNPQDTPPPPPASMPPPMGNSGYASPYAGARSFQRRPSVSNGANSLRGHRHTQLGSQLPPPPPPPPAQYASSTASSTASSSGGGGASSVSSFSPPASANQLTTGLLLTSRSSRLS